MMTIFMWFLGFWASRSDLFFFDFFCRTGFVFN